MCPNLTIDNVKQVLTRPVLLGSTYLTNNSTLTMYFNPWYKEYVIYLDKIVQCKTNDLMEAVDNYNTSLNNIF